ncbi:MAG: hypothetical protein AB8G26_13845 [Ilumatobacter sp.]
MSKILSSVRIEDTTFQEKSAITMTTILVVVFAAYFGLALGVVAESPDRDIAYTALLVMAAIVVTILAAASHVLLAVAFRSQANAHDERDWLVGLRSERIAGYVLALGVFAGIGLAIAQVDAFWIAQALIASLVAAEVVEGIVKVALYRRAN